MKLSDKKALVIDTSGQYISIGIRLAKDFDCVYYCTNWQHSFPKYNQYCAGMNVPEIERVYSPFEVLDEVDIIVFPDLFFGEFQDWLRSKGYAVFGSGSLEKMETHRDEFFELQEELGLPVSNYEVIKGISKLRKHLKGKENKWVKSNVIRGNGETFHYKNERLSESRLNEMQHTLGSYSEEAIFCVCDPVDDCVEIGHDTFIIDGEQPKDVLVGLELKDACYLSKIIPYEKIPPVLKTLDGKFKNLFNKERYRGFFSTEVRWDGKKGYCGDLTTRAGQPPSDLQQLIYDNFSEIVWQVAHGEIPEIKAKQKYGCQMIMKSKLGEPQAIYFPEKYKENVKIKNLMYKDNVPYHVPFSDIEMEEIGSVVATGNSLKEAMDNALKIAAEVEGDGIYFTDNCLEDAAKEIQKFKKYNIEMF